MADSEQLVLAGSYAAADAPGVYIFAYDAATGALVPRGALSGIANPSFLALHPNGRWLYTVSENNSAVDGIAGAVWALRFTPETLALAAINGVASGGDWPCHVALDGSGRWLVVTNYGSGSVGVLPLLDDGSVGELRQLIQHSGSGPNTARQQGPHAHSSAFTPDNRFLIVADLGIDALVIYAFDAASGQLSEHGRIAAQPGAGPRHMTFDGSGMRLYVANELDSTVAVYDYDAAQGALQLREVMSTLPEGGAPENWVADIHLSPDGRRLYVSNRIHDSIAVYGVADNGQLTAIGQRACGGSWPRNFAVSPDGLHLLVADQYSDLIATLSVLDGAAGLGDPTTSAAVPGASFVLFLPRYD